jgi:hypothetical protein
MIELDGAADELKRHGCIESAEAIAAAIEKIKMLDGEIMRQRGVVDDAYDLLEQEDQRQAAAMSNSSAYVREAHAILRADRNRPCAIDATRKEPT